MSEPIKVGDLVCVIRPTTCCNNAAALGLVFRVQSMSKGLLCVHCGARNVSALVVGGGGEWWYLPIRLLKIDPLPLSEPTETHKELQC